MLLHCKQDQSVFVAPSSYATDQSQSHSTPLTAHTATNLRNHLAGTVHDAREKVAEQPFAHTPTVSSTSTYKATKNLTAFC